MTAMSQEPGRLSSGEVLVEVQGLARVFNLSKPWLNRILERSGRVMLTAVDQVDMTIRRGETYALVGESGSGKSTIAKMVVGLLPPTSGSIRIGGVDLWSERDPAVQRAVRRQIQMIFQDPFASLNPRWRVGAIIAEPIKAFGLIDDERERNHRVEALLALVGLDPRDMIKYPHEFSGGQRQRVAIARALASDPQFIVCDEPTSALDVSVQAQVLNLLRDLQERLGLTYLFISHNLAVVRHMATQVGVLYLGRVVEQAPARSLFAQPQHPYTRMLLDSVPDIDMTGKPRVSVAGEIPNPVRPPPGCHFHPRCPLRIADCDQRRPRLLAHGESLASCHALEAGEGERIVEVADRR